MNLTTNYLGLKLPHPLIVGAAGPSGVDEFSAAGQCRDLDFAGALQIKHQAERLGYGAAGGE